MGPPSDHLVFGGVAGSEPVPPALLGWYLQFEQSLREGLRAKLRLHPYQEGQCHGGIVHASKIGVFMESVRKI